jgi:chromosomal replication initiation ATPase DnaA
LSTQLVFDLAVRPASGRDDFLVTPANQTAVALVDSWPQWPSFGAVISGAHGAGKTHLAEVWRQTANAHVTAASAVTVEAVPELLISGALVVEDVDAGQVDEAALFHLLNHVRQSKGWVLLTSSQWPRAGLLLPDLVSRLTALPVAAILQPDDALLRGVLVKHFADRQIAVDEALVSYLVARMPRSLDMARLLVSRLDAAALEQRVDVTRAFAGKILAEMENPDLL